MTAIQERDDEFLAVARQAFRASKTVDASDALATLDWWQLLAELADPEIRGAVFALFRAQGRELASSRALGVLMAQPYLEASGVASGSLLATIARESTRRGPVWVVIGAVTDAHLIIDRPGQGAAVLTAGEVVVRRVEVPGRLEIHEVALDPSRWHPTISERDAAPARIRSQYLGRIALALEMLGAAEGAFALALEHAAAREQFGQPIGAFQAVRHLLAWAATERAAIESTAMRGVALDAAAPPRYDEIVKALAGRNSQQICQRSLQVLGGIGFSAEHSHHHFHSRVLALDALLGTSADLTASLGAWLRVERHDSSLPATVLRAGGGR